MGRNLLNLLKLFSCAVIVLIFTLFWNLIGLWEVVIDVLPTYLWHNHRQNFLKQSKCYVRLTLKLFVSLIKKKYKLWMHLQIQLHIVLLKISQNKKTVSLQHKLPFTKIINKQSSQMKWITFFFLSFSNQEGNKLAKKVTQNNLMWNGV